MKRFLYTVLACSSLSLASCKKYLVSDSPSKFPEEYVFGSESDARKSVNMVYALFNQDAFTSRVSTLFAGNTDVEVGLTVGATPDGARRDLWSFEATNSNSDLLSVWNNAYNAINRANECAFGLTTYALAQDPENKTYKNLLGEVKALRAYWYMLLMHHWGDVPFSTRPTRAGDNFYLPRTGRDSILTFLVNDLRSIEPQMQWADQLDYGIERVNREFVIGLIARLSLLRGGYWLHPDMTMKRPADFLDYYRIANEYCKKLVDQKPRALPDFVTVFMNENKYVKPVNSDVLYEVAFAPGSGDVGWCTGVGVSNGISYHAYGATTISMGLTPSYYYSFDTTDVRQGATCSLISYNDTLAQVTGTVTGITINKWNRLLVPTPLGPSSSKGTSINWPLLRYADVLLMLAETENELHAGPTALAQEALRKVRQRAFPPAVWSEKVEGYIATVSAGKDAFFNALVQERAWEFGGEMTRKLDLVRWNLYGKKIAEARNTINQMGQDAVGGVGTYAKLPDYLYAKRNADKSLTFLNRFHRVTGTVPAEYTIKTTWLRNLWNTTTNGPSNYALWQWRGYADNTGEAPVRYVLPLHSSVIANSRGILKNEYGY
ncbi:RagB/SusD family nutrient uptake outer membrane protein [Paraflavisolibacter sp. H34]|uniref:RagB/SusD family nutrient uptake outer membrane protein n=1 Tax=Huijunlia imazamoxiresistens TaxID=3127457 RepID=UPI003018C55E